jgi:CubicO group peptidase (beta-lactamase class C family)
MHRTLLIAAFTALAAGQPGAAQAPAAAPGVAVADPLLRERLTTIPKIRPWPIAWFQPQEVVPGSVRRGAMPKAAPRSIDPAALDAARTYAMARGTEALMVWRDGNLELAEFGQGAGPATQLNTYYMHLPVLALLYGKAIQEGRIRSVDDPVGRYIREWEGKPQGAVTLRQLLTMHAGLEMYFDSSDPANKAARLFFGSDGTSPVLEYRSIEPAGKSFAYNYLVPEVLGIALQRAVRMPYSEYLSTRLWKPLGNGDAAVWLDSKAGGKPHFNSALFATAEDWLNIGRLILDKGRAGGKQVVPARWIETMVQPSATNPNYGMVWLGSPYVAVRRYAPDVNYVVNASAPYAAPDLVYLEGYGGQRVWVVPSKKLVIVRIGVAQRTNWDDAAIPNAVLRGVR